MWFYFLLIAIILMSLNTYLVKVLTKSIDSFIILFYQYLLALPLVIVYSFVSNASFNASPCFLLIGFLYFIAIAAFYSALKKGSLSRVSPIFNLKMIVVAVLGLLLLSEPLTIRLIIGLFFGLFGVLLLGGES